MKNSIGILALIFLISMGIFSPPSSRAGSDASEKTVITSEKLTFDYGKRRALFHGDVKVENPDLILTCENLTVAYNQNGALRDIQAVENVFITQADKQASAGRASYNLAKGEFILRDEPRVKQGSNILTGDVIHFWRNENRMVCEPNARLVVFMGDLNQGDKGKNEE